MIEYKGFIIEIDTDIWAVTLGSKYKFYKEGERVYSVLSEEDARNQIDDIELSKTKLI